LRGNGGGSIGAGFPEQGECPADRKAHKIDKRPACRDVKREGIQNQRVENSSRGRRKSARLTRAYVLRRRGGKKMSDIERGRVTEEGEITPRASITMIVSEWKTRGGEIGAVT